MPTPLGRTDFQCKGCGVSITRRPGRPEPKFCSRECCIAFQSNPHGQCERCGRPVRNIRRYCSMACFRKPRPIVKCRECGKDLKLARVLRLPQFCNRECRYASTEMRRISVMECRKLADSGLTRNQLALHFGVTKAVMKNFVSKHGLPVRSAHPSERWIRTTNYRSLHTRVAMVRGQPNKCEKCGGERSRYEWANLTGNYGDVMDYKRLCKKCHVRFDIAKTHGLTVFGKTLAVPEWAELLGAKRGVIEYRIKAGWPLERAVTAPPGQKKTTHRGKSQGRLL